MYSWRFFALVTDNFIPFLLQTCCLCFNISGEFRVKTAVYSNYWTPHRPSFLQNSTVESSKAAFFGAPRSPALTIGKYLAENLHPPILSVTSYLTASAFEAASGHRALFFLPNSFVAMMDRERSDNFAERFFSTMRLILPSIILAIWLAYRVSKDAVVVGLSENARLYWIIVTLAFGLTAYITYRLTRPKITLVTCPNCGKMRRPDMVKCHPCKSDWHIPELTPPAWRVLKGAEKVDGGSTDDVEDSVVE